MQHPAVSGQTQQHLAHAATPSKKSYEKSPLQLITTPKCATIQCQGVYAKSRLLHIIDSCQRDFAATPLYRRSMQKYSTPSFAILNDEHWCFRSDVLKRLCPARHLHQIHPIGEVWEWPPTETH
jgi:hypothetical protein